MKAQSFHLMACVLLALAAFASLVVGGYALAGFFGLGAFVALLHWKATKSGVIDF